MRSTIRRLGFVNTLVLLVSILFLRCGEDPASVGIGFFPNDPQLDSLSLIADSSSTYRARIAGNGATLLVGQYQNIEARTLLQFGPLPSGLSDTLVVSATIRLIPRYWFQDSVGTLAFTVHKLLESQDQWNSDTIKFDQTDVLYDPQSIGTFARLVSPQDTLIDVSIDTATVRGWLRDGLTYPRGVMLKPLPTGNIVYGFTSDVFDVILPQLLVRYHVPDSARIDSFGVLTFRDVFVANGPEVPPTEHIILQGGLADRGKVGFNVTGIPRSAGITRATMEFTRDLTMSIRNEFSIDSIVVQQLLDYGSPPIGGIARIAKATSEDGVVFTADITAIVQQWAVGRANYGVALRAYGENSTLDRFAIYGALNADVNKRPKLRIAYTKLIDN